MINVNFVYMLILYCYFRPKYIYRVKTCIIYGDSSYAKADIKCAEHIWKVMRSSGTHVTTSD